MPATSIASPGRTRLYPSTSIFASDRPEPLRGTSFRRQFLVERSPRPWTKPRVTEFPESATELTVGRSGECELQLVGPGLGRVHAALIRRPHRGVYLRPVTDGAPTLVNGQPVSGEILLMDGDRIRLGGGIDLEFVDGRRISGSRVRQWAQLAMRRVRAKA